MEADWSVELAADDPVIVVPWAASGDETRKCQFIDLRLGGHLIDGIEEARTVPALRSALLMLNNPGSPLWTAKCDAWNNHEPQDAYEMDAELDETDWGAGSYIDLLARDSGLLSSFERQERWARMMTGKIRALPAKACRVEFIVRLARVDNVMGFGVTWFVEGCGSSAQRAAQAWSLALNRTLAVIMDARNDTMSKSGE